MNLNSILFPAPKCSYTAESLENELIWVPKYTKSFIAQPAETSRMPVSTSANSFIRSHTHTSSTLSYDTPLLKSKSPVTITDSAHKPESKIPDLDEISFITTASSKKTGMKDPISPYPTNQVLLNQMLEAAVTEGEKSVKLAEQKISTENKAENPKINFSVMNQKNGKINRKNSEESFDLDDSCDPSTNDTRPLAHDTTQHKLTIKRVPMKSFKAKKNLTIQTKENELLPINGMSRESSQTSFDQAHTDEYNDLRMQLHSPRMMFKYGTKLLVTPASTKSTATGGLHKLRNYASTPKTAYPSTSSHAVFNSQTFSTSTIHSMSPQPKSMFLSSIKKVNTCHTPKKSDQSRHRQSHHMKTCSGNMVETYIPCLLLRSGLSTNKIIVYFHGNGEDINLAYDLLGHLRNNLNVNVLAVEYPGYGMYKGAPEDTTIMQDSEAVYDFLVQRLKIAPKNIIIFGRSIGSGPATYLAANREVGALVLMSAFTSIRAVAKGLAGRWVQYLIKERFNNLETISRVACPTFLVHGQRDRLISYTHSEELHNACRAASELLLPKEMDHIEFDFYEDFTLPLMHFLERCGVNIIQGGGSIYFPRSIFETPANISRTAKRPSTPKTATCDGSFKSTASKSILSSEGMTSREAKSSLLGF